MTPTEGHPGSVASETAEGAPAATGTAVVVGVDPGRNVGLAWVAADGALLRAEVVDEAALARLAVADGVAVALGSGTGSRAARARLETAGLTVALVDEHATTEEGRRLYWRCHPARGWHRWLPVGLRPPPAAIDAYAAYAIALRWLAATEKPRTPGGVRDQGR